MNTSKLQWRRAALSMVLAGASAVSFHAAATPKPAGLLNKLPGKVQGQLPQQAISGRSNAVKVNKGRLRNGRFFVELPDGVSFEAVRDIEYDFGGGKSAWVGHANGNQRTGWSLARVATRCQVPLRSAKGCSSSSPGPTAVT